MRGKTCGLWWVIQHLHYHRKWEHIKPQSSVFCCCFFCLMHRLFSHMHSSPELLSEAHFNLTILPALYFSPCDFMWENSRSDDVMCLAQSSPIKPNKAFLLIRLGIFKELLLTWRLDFMNSNSSLLSLEQFCSGFGWRHWDIVPPLSLESPQSNLNALYYILKLYWFIVIKDTLHQEWFLRI